MDYRENTPENPTPGFMAGIIGLSKNLSQLFLTRVELASIELKEVRQHLGKAILLFILGMFAVGFAIAYWSVLIAVVAWPTWGWKILLLLALVFTVFSLAIFWQLRSMVQQNKFSLNATMAELRKDRDALL